jgi:N-acetyl-gamma-glutamylphosphate reductase
MGTKYYQANKEHCKALAKQWRSRNGQKVIDANAKWRAANEGYNASYYENHKAKLCVKARNRYRSTILGLPVDHPELDRLWDERQSNKGRK